eukprot:scaffold1638_cov98-Isochrysis_galbana.AAC.1
MSEWLNPVVARLASGDRCEGEYCGLLLVCSWPMPPAVREQALAFAAALTAETQHAAQPLPAGAYVYPPSTLHCTVATLRPFTAGPLVGSRRDEELDRWRSVLTSARQDPDWPSGHFRLRMRQPTLEGAAGIFRYDDCDGAVVRMRAALHRAIEQVRSRVPVPLSPSRRVFLERKRTQAGWRPVTSPQTPSPHAQAGGRAAEGGADRSLARPLPGSPAGTSAPHLPDIVHSTVLRWAAEVPYPERPAARAAFGRAAATVAPVTFSVSGGAVRASHAVNSRPVPGSKCLK